MRVLKNLFEKNKNWAKGMNTAKTMMKGGMPPVEAARIPPAERDATLPAITLPSTLPPMEDEM